LEHFKNACDKFLQIIGEENKTDESKI
jgi:hypothetical protein